MGEIIVKNLAFAYNNSDALIRCSLFSFKPGNIYALVGSNGSGKTTFLKLVLGLLKPTEGSISGIENESVAFVPDYNGLYDSLSILENIKFRLSLYNKIYKAEKDAVQKLLTRYRLDNEAHKLVRDLSLGMKKKVALICALAVDPTILILDEPTGGLDADAQEELSNMLGQFISPERIVICTSHDSDFLKSLPVCCVVSFPMEA
ncbi:MAG: ABC transporter ATP-binding protein [Christensenellaceae bacterium]|nr:ABC transporter ATP-binding protein [Christensenellaceae bacterium]